jgi:hypothetical protein
MEWEVGDEEKAKIKIEQGKQREKKSCNKKV